jgi:hypothetical protein
MIQLDFFKSEIKFKTLEKNDYVEYVRKFIIKLIYFCQILTLEQFRFESELELCMFMSF